MSAVLEHLSIPYVVPLSHSAGTIYALNLLSQRRDLLWPNTPLAVLMGSSMSMMGKPAADTRRTMG